MHLPANPAEMRSPEFQDKMKRGPAVLLTVMPPWSGSMAGNLSQWFGYCLVVSVFAAFIAGPAPPHRRPPSTHRPTPPHTTGHLTPPPHHASPLHPYTYHHQPPNSPPPAHPPYHL